MGTFASIQARVRTRLIDLPSAVNDEVPNLVTEAIHTLQDMHNFKVMEATTTVLTNTSNRVLSSFPGLFKEWRGDPYRASNLGTSYPLTFAHARQAPSLVYSDTSIGPPQFVLDTEPNSDGVRQLEVWPFPDGASDYPDGQYRVVLPYYGYLPTLTGGGSNWFTINAEEWIVRKAVAEGFAIDWDEQRVAFWEARAKEKYDMVINRDKRFRLSGVTTLVPLWQGANSPQLRT